MIHSAGIRSALAVLVTLAGCNGGWWPTKGPQTATAEPAAYIPPYGTRTRASARHILVAEESQCQELKARIEDGADFAALAAAHSTCPSGKSGGDLGEFGQGQMAAEFDRVVFSGDIGPIYGPVKTKFGYHLIQITARND
jgi:peptidyl-prolyl cis-trans isomerase C